MKTKKNWIALYMTVLMLFSSLSCGTTVSAAEPEARDGDISQNGCDPTDRIAVFHRRWRERNRQSGIR